MNFIQYRKVYYVISIVVVLFSLVTLFTKGLNMGIDFRGGSILQVRMEQNTDVNAVRDALKEIKMDKADVSKSGDEIFIRTHELSQNETQNILNHLNDKFGKAEFRSAESVGASIGNELKRNSILAVIIAAIAMMLYIALRFEYTTGIASIVKELHDVSLVLGLFALFQWEVNTPFIAGLLTVVGYSINDSIVIFDRIRENLRMKKKEDYLTLVNKSITQSLNRSINTVLVSVFALIALLLFGGTSIKVFVLTMLIGFLVGGYSSIFVASPIWYDLKSKQE
ncbi:MAG: protein translocase subunit SecF [Syntrophomonadaceae bacterium]|nr:protein translocase subunit SecF [Syntrophomonadaceae bacterium]